MMDKISAFAKADDILRRCPHRVKRFQLKKVGQSYYIFAHAKGLVHPAIVGRYNEAVEAKQDFEHLEKIIGSAQGR